VIIGRVTHMREALVTLLVSGPDGREIPIVTVLDTGFTDYLTLPLTVISDLQLPAMDTAECQLADGRIVTMESFAAWVQWDGSSREILVLATDGDPLLGMPLCRIPA